MSEGRASYRIADIEISQRPRERLASAGASALSHAELLAILLGSGTEGLNAVQLAEKLLNENHGLLGLQRISYDELCDQRGIGPAKAAQLQAAFELGGRIATATPEQRMAIQSPREVADLVGYEMRTFEQEHLRVLLLDTRNRLIRQSEVYQGSLNASLIRIGEIFRDAVRRNAAAIIVVHNHPSGDSTPSPEDVAVTRAIVEAGKLLDIEVLDHIIIGGQDHTSLKAKNLGFR